ncbi:hypothetical protein ACEUC3_10275 [Aeromonas bivalvium]|uniref:Uncharacterized protein n=1 Tax=Aeromonas bivalvium TaxID=440079 RepID=A0ABW9GPZ2_9GAMM|nr:hypothetical protein [Aeromonas bivalvium]
MTRNKFANEMIIRNGGRCSWRYRVRDLLILLLTWGGWLLLALQPWFNYLGSGSEVSFIGSLDWLALGQLFLALVLGLFLLIHTWARYNKWIHLLVRRRTL